MSELPTTESVQQFRDRFHRETVSTVRDAVAGHDIVVVGMGWNPHVRAVRQALAEQKLDVHYIGIGTYAGQWRERLAVKLWSGWPTFPQVFVKGTLVGGNARTRKALDDGTLQALLEAPRAWPADTADRQATA